MPAEYDRLRETIEQSAFAPGMLGHLDELSEPALRQYLAEFFSAMIRSTGRGTDALAADFLNMTTEVLREQASYGPRRTGEPFDPAKYADPDFMDRCYLDGLSLALVFWPNHWRTLRYLEECLLGIPAARTGRLLDLGCGHGLFSARFAARRPEWRVAALDISPRALERTGCLWDELGLDRGGLSLVEADVMDFLQADGPKMDVILFCELLEHLSDSRGAMELVARRLAPEGIILLTTALNSFFYDHLTYFRSLDEVESIVAASGLEILDLRAHKVADTPAGPQSDVIALLVHSASSWTERLGDRSSREGLHHVGCLTHDLDASVNRRTGRGARLVFGPVTDLRIDCRVAFLDQPPMPALTEVVQPYSPSSNIRRRLSANRLDHLCFQCGNLEEAVAEHESQGAHLTLGPVTAAAMQRRVAFVVDTEGVLIELLEKGRGRPWFL